MNKNLSEYKKKYHRVRHHAWAGTVLLTVLSAFRIYLGMSNISIDIYNTFFLIIFPILIGYILLALFFTYKYSSGLSADSEKVIHLQDDAEKEKIQAEIEKERIKAEEKKAKEEAKARKKEAKAKAKAAKKTAKAEEKKLKKEQNEEKK